MKSISSVSLFLFLIQTLCAQDPSSGVAIQPRQLVNAPTAGMLPRGSYEIGMRLFENGGLLGTIDVGMSERFMFGISYGGEKFIGSGKVNFNPLPGVDVRYRAIDESITSPAVVVGFNNQGFGRFIKRDTSGKRVDRYIQKAPGLFIVGSKNYEFAGTIGLHGGMTWAVTEKKDKDREPAFFVGVDKSINKELSAVGEYNLALNDNKKVVGHGRGYMNIGAKFNFDNKVLIEFIMTDILNNSKDFGKFSRELRLSIVNVF